MRCPTLTAMTWLNYSGLKAQALRYAEDNLMTRHRNNRLFRIFYFFYKSIIILEE